MGYMSERKLKGEIERMRKEMDERIKRLEDSLEEASKPKENEPAENKVKECIYCIWIYNIHSQPCIVRYTYSSR